MSGSLVHLIRDLYESAIDAVRPDVVVREAFRETGRGHLEVAGVEISAERQVYAIALGKASIRMMLAAEDVLGERLQDGIVVTKSAEPEIQLESRVLTGSHPVPDSRSLEAGEALHSFARSVPEGALVLCLISGGGSALAEALRPGISIDDLQTVTRDLLKAGASIHELNAVRARMSRIKAGGLLRALGHAQVVNLIISDVLGDDLSTIASGPTVPRVESIPAEDVLRRYGVSYAVPEDESSDTVSRPATMVLSNVGAAIAATADAARAKGLHPVVLTRSLTGEARHVGTTMAAILADSAGGHASFGHGTCLIAGGETTVNVRGQGTGGRNTEAALAAALSLRGTPDVAIGFLATDGDDSETGVAGAIVTGDTVTPADAGTATLALHDNDTYTFLKARDATWGTGPTGTNVNDLVIGIVG